MAQIKRFSWTNPAVAVAREESIGFEVAKVEIWDLTTPGRFEWTADMADDSFFTLGTLAYTTSNGITPLAQPATFGAPISAFTNAAPGVIAIPNSAIFGFAVGDTIKVAGLADDGAGTASLNGTFTIASVTPIAITLVESTVGFSAYVSGGFVTRVTDVNDVAIPTENVAIQGITIGTGAVGANSASMVAICYGNESVV